MIETEEQNQYRNQHSQKNFIVFCPRFISFSIIAHDLFPLFLIFFYFADDIFVISDPLFIKPCKEGIQGVAVIIKQIRLDHGVYRHLAWIVVILVILLKVFYYGLTNYRGYGDYDFVGLRNFADLFTDLHVGGGR